MVGVTQILKCLEDRQNGASVDLLPLVYDELRRLARSQLAKESSGATLQATALVHEAYIRLVGSCDIGWNGRGHFFGAAAEAMRRILIERARKRQSQKRGHGLQCVPLDSNVSEPLQDDKLLQLDQALAQFELEYPEKARLVKLRFFGGMTNREAAEILGVSPATAHRYWVFSRAWLQRNMHA